MLEHINRRLGQTERLALRAAVAVLITTAVAKLVSVVSRGGPFVGELGRPNLVWDFLSEGSLLLIAAVAECGLAMTLWRLRSRVLSFGLLTWFCAICWLYRATLHAIRPGKAAVVQVFGMRPCSHSAIGRRARY